jgi:hypothetical protein
MAVAMTVAAMRVASDKEGEGGKAMETVTRCWNPQKWVHTKRTLTKSGFTDTERKSRDESRRRTQYLLLAGPTGSYV